MMSGVSNPDRPLVTKPPVIPEPLPQRAGPDSVTAARGSDGAPMRWAGAGQCGHKIAARVGPPLVAMFADQTEVSEVPHFAIVDAEPGECPVCDDANGVAVRDA